MLGRKYPSTQCKRHPYSRPALPCEPLQSKPVVVRATPSLRPRRSLSYSARPSPHAPRPTSVPVVQRQCATHSKPIRPNGNKGFRGWGRGGGDPFAKGSLPHKAFRVAIDGPTTSLPHKTFHIAIDGPTTSLPHKALHRGAFLSDRPAFTSLSHYALQSATPIQKGRAKARTARRYP